MSALVDLGPPDRTRCLPVPVMPAVRRSWLRLRLVHRRHRPREASESLRLSAGLLGVQRHCPARDIVVVVPGNLGAIAINPISAQLNLLAVTTRADAGTANVRQGSGNMPAPGLMRAARAASGGTAEPAC